MAYWRLFYHLVWATRSREPLIGEREETIIRRSFQTTLDSMRVIPHAIGMMPDHTHVVASIPPSVLVAEVVKRLKGASTHAVNHESGVPPEVPFAWQGGYGVLSFSERALPDVVAYVRNQREHHAKATTWPGLERTDEDA
ncbi:MAG TPA: IS200/IS605 family transposase [Thermomicrobiales bacterium]